MDATEPNPAAHKPWPQVPMPFLTAELEDMCDERKLAPHEWYAQALEELSRQLGVANDYYYPLLGAAQALREANTALTAIATMAPTEIAPGVVHGPKLLFDNCQRFARDAIRHFRARIRRGG